MTGELLRESSRQRVFVVGKEHLKPREIPSIAVWGETLPEAWETAVLATLEYGTEIPTEYDQAVDPESKDASVMITVTNPLKEPRIHKALPCGLSDLAVYVREVVEGIHDSWVKPDGWSYSYHDRLFNWPGVNKKFEVANINQIDALIKKLAVAPHSRRAQATTWVPPMDATEDEPPCLQRLWFRVVNSGDVEYLLEMNTHWRSRDALKAAFMNMYAFVELQQIAAGKLSEAIGRKVGVGRYVDISDSFHIYGSYTRKGEIAAFVASLQKLSFERRVYRSDSQTVQEEFAEGMKRK